MDIESIKTKVLANNFQLTKEEKLTVIDVYFEITKIATGKGKVLSLGCHSCFLGAFHIIQNYINFHYIEPTIAKAIVEVITVGKTYKQLLAECKSKGIEVPHNAKKIQLINLLK